MPPNALLDKPRPRASAPAPAWLAAVCATAAAAIGAATLGAPDVLHLPLTVLPDVAHDPVALLTSSVQMRWGTKGFISLQVVSAALAAAGGHHALGAVTRGARRLALTAAALVVFGPALADPHTALGLALLGPVLATWWRTSLDGRARWWLPALSWLAALVHPLWLLGPIVGLVLTVPPTGRAAITARSPLTHRASVPALVAALSVVAGSLTPQGISAITAPFAAVAQAIPLLGASPTHSIRQPATLLAVALLGATWLAWRRADSPAPGRHLLLWSLALVLALTSTQALAAAGLVVVLLAGHTTEVLRASGRSAHAPRSSAARRAAAPLVAVGCATLLVLPPSVAQARGHDALVEPLRSLPVTARVIAEPGEVTWLERVAPDSPLVSGLRVTDPVPDRVALASLLTAAPGWDRTVTTEQLGGALLPATSPLALALRVQLGWSVVGEAADFLVLEAPQ